MYGAPNLFTAGYMARQRAAIKAGAVDSLARERRMQNTYLTNKKKATAANLASGLVPGMEGYQSATPFTAQQALMAQQKQMAEMQARAAAAMQAQQQQITANASKVAGNAQANGGHASPLGSGLSLPGGIDRLIGMATPQTLNQNMAGIQPNAVLPTIPMPTATKRAVRRGADKTKTDITGAPVPVNDVSLLGRNRMNDAAMKARYAEMKREMDQKLGTVRHARTPSSSTVGIPSLPTYVNPGMPILPSVPPPQIARSGVPQPSTVNSQVPVQSIGRPSPSDVVPPQYPTSAYAPTPAGMPQPLPVSVPSAYVPQPLSSSLHDQSTNSSGMPIISVWDAKQGRYRPVKLTRSKQKPIFLD